MKNTNQVVLKSVGAATLLAVTFALGFVLGSNSQKSTLQTEKSLSSSNIEHAFGKANKDQQATGQATPHEPMVKGLGGLVEGLEKKVAADPANINHQLLLAQTYKELNEYPKSIKLLRTLHKQYPKDPQVKITLASVLMTGTEKQDLQEALQVFDEAIKLKPEAASMARMYQGEIKSKLQYMAKK